MYVCMHVCICVSFHPSIYLYLQLYKSMYECMHACMYVRVHVYIDMNLYIRGIAAYFGTARRWVLEVVSVAACYPSTMPWV